MLLVTQTKLEPSNELRGVVGGLVRVLELRPSYQVVAKTIFLLVALCAVHVDYTVWSFKSGLGTHITNLVKAKPADAYLNL